jgi:uncharacterized protein
MKTQKTKLSPDFVRAVRSGDSTLLRKALAEGADPNQLVDGERPLLRPILGFTEVLIKAGADVDVRDKNGSTVLHLLPLSVQENSGNYDSMIRAIAAKSNCIDFQNADGMSPLMVACKAGRLESVRVLLDLGADPNLVNKQTGHNALFDAITSSVATKESDKIVALLLQKKSRLEIHDSELGWTPLMSAVFMNRINQVKMLLECGADLRKRSLGLHGYPVETALNVAERMGYSELVNVLGT